MTNMTSIPQGPMTAANVASARTEFAPGCGLLRRLPGNGRGAQTGRAAGTLQFELAEQGACIWRRAEFIAALKQLPRPMIPSKARERAPKPSPRGCWL